MEFFVSYKDFRAAHQVNNHRKLSIINWSKEFSNFDCDTKAEKFYSIINNNLIEKYVLSKHSSSSSNFPKWFSKDLREFIRNKNEAHWVYKLSVDEDDYIEFKRLHAICVRKRKERYAECIRKVEDSSFYYNVKSFWSFVNSKKKSFGIPNSVFLNSIKSPPDGRIACIQIGQNRFHKSLSQFCTNYRQIATACVKCRKELGTTQVFR